MKPRRASWWIGVLFAVGSACFVVAPFPGFVELVGSTVDGLVFFVGSIFFTAAATLQFLDSGPLEPRRIDWWSCSVQVVGTLFFNVSTFRALQAGLDTTEYNRLVWRPDALGSICFLVSGCLAYVEVCGWRPRRPRRSPEWWIAAVNLAGCVFFGISAIAGHIVPATGSARDLAAANSTTVLGALCFLAGAILVLRGSPDGYTE